MKRSPSFRELLESLEGSFGDRCRRHGAGPLATVLPASVEEVVSLARAARRYSVALHPSGAEMDPDLSPPEGEVILVSTRMLRAVRFPDEERRRVEVGPGVLWLELENELHTVHRALPVYPTSAPRTTVGGWLARDGVGVGSFACGWLGENVLSVRVVTPEGHLRTLEGAQVRSVIGALGKTGVIVQATLRLRETTGDRPFAAVFERASDLQRAVVSLLEQRPPLWHLGFANPPMAETLGVRGRYLLFGASLGGGAEPEDLLARILAGNRGRSLDVAEAYRVWGSRFFPADPSRPTPSPGRVLVPASRAGGVLEHAGAAPVRLAVLGSVSRDGSALLLAFAVSGKRLASLGAGDEAGLVGAARSAGGELYHEVLRRRAVRDYTDGSERPE
ncbi:hypothetical protein RxyAA322_16790 [Rubrobacter xylanophilus]|uniref:FAD-binding PCMH-type domain-containing protein n=1 Tax=Rubrobacter xylanophilus TaxID=49319 RepID=A0A510HKJ7_9ACTN|nr:FAD-binding oxidoreductase [Rubrobacter xylanophilus]BBL79825.1 hypothetical protein RxyAA322_16790 [Rubrobacter xylanophilus]